LKVHKLISIVKASNENYQIKQRFRCDQ